MMSGGASLLTAAASILLALAPSAAAASPFGQLLSAYYSGVAPDTVGAGGVNALALAFFDPTPLATTSNCNFSDANTPCVAPASGSGDKTLAWALSSINETLAQLVGNTAPIRGGRPTYFFSFGGQSQGGQCWDAIMGSAALAAQAGSNMAWLAGNVSARLGGAAFVGVDLDVEGTATQLPHMAAFVAAFRAVAAPTAVPLQLCALSSLADPASPDHYKLVIMQTLGPGNGSTTAAGFTHINLMVDNVEASCAAMAAFWLAPALDFLPPTSKVLGVWGEIYPSWILPPPGCTDGAAPLYAWIASAGVNIGIWQWWTGPVSDIAALIAQIRAR